VLKQTGDHDPPVHALIVIQQDPERLVYAALLDNVSGFDVDVTYHLQTTDRREYRPQSEATAC
jgi:hypothetical protein